MILEERLDVPLAIVRPPIIVASHKEPFPGWVDNYNAATGKCIQRPLVVAGVSLQSKGQS